MVFWQDAPALFTERSFSTHLIQKSPVPSPTGSTAIRVTAETATPSLLTEICTYLRTYFGDPPRTPILDIPEQLLLGPMDYLFLLRDANEQIIGTLRYRYVGELMVKKAPAIYRVDAFCVHPAWRRKGVGDYLLTELQRYATAQGQPYAMFLKEGRNLFIFNRPLYSGVYVYRKVTYTKNAPHIQLFSTLQAQHMLELYHRIYPRICIIYNQRENQHWRYYKKGYHTILACFQDTYQRMPQTKEKIGWCTCWLESSVVTDETREEAAIELTNSLPSFDYVWMNKQWVGKNSQWIQDGGFHWYTYQWSTSLELDTSMCILD